MAAENSGTAEQIVNEMDTEDETDSVSTSTDPVVADPAAADEPVAMAEEEEVVDVNEIQVDPAQYVSLIYPSLRPSSFYFSNILECCVYLALVSLSEDSVLRIIYL